MLELRPNCELCDKNLPANAADAMICTYECTFCTNCVESVLKNVCPNCGGGFCKRPIRPKTDYRTGVSLEYQKASTMRVNTEYSLEEISNFSMPLRNILPNER